MRRVRWYVPAKLQVPQASVESAIADFPVGDSTVVDGAITVNDYRGRRPHATAPLSQGSQNTKSADTLHIRGRP